MTDDASPAPQTPSDTTGTGDQANAGLPIIRADNGDLAQLTDCCLGALRHGYADVNIYRYAGRLVRVEADAGGRPQIEYLTAVQIRHHLARNAQFFVQGRSELESAHPPMSACQDILAMSDAPFPHLEAVVSAPFVTPGGEIALKAGYYADCRVLLAPATDMEIPQVNTTPTSAEVNESRSLLVELFHDFPFVGASDLAHAILLLLMPIIRYLVCGPAPMTIITKLHPGTGAGLITDVQGLISIGTGLSVMTEGNNDEETRKRITAKLRTSPRVIVIDNLRRRLDSSALAAALTTDLWEDRVIGSSNLTRLPTRGVTWVVTGNNVRTSIEIARRAIQITMDARMAQPWLRQDFRHPELLTWVKANLGRLRWALLTLVQSWLAAGRPAPTTGPRIGSFEGWCDVAGGILEIAGIPGFLGNRDALYAATDPQGETLRGFVASWWAGHRDAPVGVTNLFPIAESAGIDLGHGSDRSRQTKLGIAVREMAGRRYVTHSGQILEVNRAGMGTGNQSGAQLWALSEPGSSPIPATTNMEVTMPS